MIPAAEADAESCNCVVPIGLRGMPLKRFAAADIDVLATIRTGDPLRAEELSAKIVRPPKSASWGKSPRGVRILSDWCGERPDASSTGDRGAMG